MSQTPMRRWRARRGGTTLLAPYLARRKHAQLFDKIRLQVDARRYRYLRNRDSMAVLTGRGPGAGVWCDYENDDGDLILLTGGDLDVAVDEAITRGDE